MIPQKLTPVTADVLAMASGVTTIAAWQEQLDWALRIIAALIAIAAGAVALWQRLKHRRK